MENEREESGVSEEFKEGDLVRLTGRGWRLESTPERGSEVRIHLSLGLFAFWAEGREWYVSRERGALWGAELVERRVAPWVPEIEAIPDPVPSADSGTHPGYYKFPNGLEAIDVTKYLTSAGGQAAQYVIRATRLDGVFKSDRVEDLRKAQKWLDVEIERLEALGEGE